MTKQPTWREAIDAVLASAGTPLHYKEIANRIVASGLRTNVGATPAATVSAQISALMKHSARSPYIRVRKGMLALATEPAEDVPDPEAQTANIAPGHYGIVTAFGVSWLRDAVRWDATPRLLGAKQAGAAPIDFNRQAGIYLLSDGQEVIYVGQTAERRLGRTLLGHTLDRLKSRWDRFSWFGLLPLSASGQFGSLPPSYDADMVMHMLHAVLIETLEPRQNRARVSDPATPEYIQRDDPSLRKGGGPVAPSTFGWQPHGG